MQMRRVILSLSIVFVLAWAAGSVLAQSQGKGKEQGDRPADHAAKMDVNAPTTQDIEKKNKEKMKDLQERGPKQMEARGKAAKDQIDQKMGEMKGKAHEQQAQQRMAIHMKRQAQLNRLRELAVQKGDDKMVARIDKLIAHENQLHERKVMKMQGQKRMGEMMPPTAPPQAQPQAPAQPPAQPPAQAQPQTPPPAGQTAPAPAPEKPAEGTAPAAPAPKP
jgi:hypothetical protein